MPDDKKVTQGDKQGLPQTAPAPVPIKEPKIDVTVTPKPGKGNREYAERVKENVQRDVQRAIEKAAPGGSGKQLESADAAAERAAQQITPSKIEKIKVNVEGDAGGRPVKHEKTVPPSECKPPEKKSA